MIISFFEEFPTRKNLQRLRLVKWPAKLYLGCSSLQEFKRICSGIRNRHCKELIYWPILKKNEGYWISPFSKRKSLRRVFQELHGQKIPVMLDLELPTTQNPLLYITQAVYFWVNKRTIQNFIRRYDGEIYLAEYYPEGRRSEQIMLRLGLHYSNHKVKFIKMLYHSLHHFSDNFLRQELERGRQEYKERFIPAYGVIAPGIQGTEVVLSQVQLEKDLQLAKNAGVKEVIIFRLGGLNKGYLRIVQEFSYSKSP